MPHVLLWLLAVVLVATPAGAQPAPAAADPITWGIRPSSSSGPDGRDAFSYSLAPGARIDDYVGVSNFTNAPLVLAVYATDAFTSPSGQYDVQAAGVDPVGVGRWIDFAARTVTVPANARLDIPFRLTVPLDAMPGDHPGGIVASLARTAADAAGNAFTVDHRVGTRVHLRVDGALAPAVSVSDVSVEFDSPWSPLAAGTAIIGYTVTNTGNVRLAGTPNLDVAGPFGFASRQVPGERFDELLPGSSRAFAVEVGGVRPLGRVTAEVQLRAEPIGADGVVAPIASSTAPATAVPWSALVSVAAVSLAVMAFARVRATRRGAAAARLATARAEGRRAALDVLTGVPSADASIDLRATGRTPDEMINLRADPVSTEADARH